VNEVIGGKCDLCSDSLKIGEIVYTYMTPSTGTEEEAKAGTAFYATDPAWGICPPCHQIVQQYDRSELGRAQTIVELIKRWSVNNSFVIIGGDPSKNLDMQKASVEFGVRVMKSFLDYKTHDWEEEVNQGVPAGGGPRDWGRAADDPD
jgi:hypothetical protein